MFLIQAVADELVLWDYDLHTLPPGWDVDFQWEFPGDCARFQASCYGYTGGYYGNLGSFDTCAVLSGEVDSLVIYADQNLYLYGYMDYCFVEAHVSLNNGSTWKEVFYESSNFSTSDPLHICISETPQSGDSVQVKFYAAGYGSNYGGSEALWELENFTLTPWGNGMVLNQWTWGALKQTF